MRNIFQGLQSLWYWAPVIWKWRPWDWSFTIDVLIHSLEAQRELEIKYKRHTNWARQAREMSITIEALRRLQNRDEDRMLELVDDPKGILGKSLVVRKDAWLGTKRAVFDYEGHRQKMYLEIATSQLRKHLLSFWD